MKIDIKYESETFLPDEIEEAFRLCKNRMNISMPEFDKILIDLENLRRDILFWIAENSVINKE